MSWADIARAVYVSAGRDEADVTPVSTEDYFAGKTDYAPRPLQSAMSLAKIEATGFEPEDARVALARYLSADG
jgi:dTDP-4-dehydrorhamnose 3,5-epimerase